ncbi:MAG: peptidoglycan editing factor PgeF [Acidobacteria bacterium]|nr:MAG: peptidoglycan editing factor PgeF [Acidobacteriota bacterium]
MTHLADQTGQAIFIKSGGFDVGGGCHAFSTREGGVPHGGQLEGSLARFLAAAGFPAGCTPVPLRQVHGNQVHTIPPGAHRSQVPTADGAVTSRSDVILLLQTADCVPILLRDTTSGVVGVIHAGWRGALAGVVARTLEAMASLGASPSSIRAAIGPAIGPCCFEVGEEVAAPFARLSPALIEGQGPSWRLDLPGAVAHLLRRAGVPGEDTRTVAACTRCRTDLFFSHRGEKGLAGRLIAAITLA